MLLAKSVIGSCDYLWIDSVLYCGCEQPDCGHNVVNGIVGASWYIPFNFWKWFSWSLNMNVLHLMQKTQDRPVVLHGSIILQSYRTSVIRTITKPGWLAAIINRYRATACTCAWLKLIVVNVSSPLSYVPTFNFVLYACCKYSAAT